MVKRAKGTNQTYTMRLALGRVAVMKWSWSMKESAYLVGKNRNSIYKEG